MIIPVILAGGVGSRLWPLSQQTLPKQFIQWTEGNTLFQETIRRVESLPEIRHVLVTTHRDHVEQIRSQLAEEPRLTVTVLAEPARKSTAPAIAIAAMQALSLEEDPRLLVLPSDHVLTQIEAFQKAVRQAAQFAGDYLVCFGITPTRPETGYGYLKCGPSLGAAGGAYRIEKFVEKPDLARAEEYLASGQYYWNGGMFLFRAKQYLQELERYAPEIASACRAAFAKRSCEGPVVTPSRAEFASCPANSIDYAVMERTEKAAAVPLDAGWIDLGSWRSVWESQSKDEAGNVTRGDVLLRDTRNSYVHATTKRVVVLGMQDCVVVESEDAVLVVPQASCQQVRHVADCLQEKS